jgi:hypothetical protein
MHLLQAQGHVDDDLRDVLRQNGVGAADEQFEVGAFDVFHQQKRAALDLAVLEVIDDVFVVMNLGKNFAAVEKAAAFGEVEERVVDHAAQGEMLALRIGREPYFGHAAAIDQFFKVKAAKPPWLDGRFWISLGFAKRHINGGNMPQRGQIRCENLAFGKASRIDLGGGGPISLPLVDVVRAYRYGPDGFALDLECRPQIARDIHGVDCAAIRSGQPMNLVGPQARIAWVGFENWKRLKRRSLLDF